MADITKLIEADHDTFRRQFAQLCDDRPDDATVLTSLWTPLAELLDRHAGAEEATFYPHLLSGDKDAEDETTDAIRDHDKIRDAVRSSQLQPVGSDAWWSAVLEARKENDEHMREEEEGPLPDFVTHSTPGERDRLAAAFLAYKEEHRGAAVDAADKDPEEYVATHRNR